MILSASYLPFLGVFGGRVGTDLNENNGKASILCEAGRLLKDLFCQIEALKKENVTLLSESHYVRLTLFFLLLHFILLRVLHIKL